MTYTGTHDNNTTLGWWLDDCTDVERRNVATYLQTIGHPAEIVWALIRCAARSVANIAIFPLQDILHLGSEARMNTPAAGAGELDLALCAGCASSGLRDEDGEADGDDRQGRLRSAD